MNPLHKIATIMTPDPITVMASTSLDEARALFAEHHIHHLPVVDTEGVVIGMLSQSDYLKAHGQDLNSVGDLMTKGLAKLEADDTVRTAANLFTLNKFHALPIVDANNHLVGIVTTLDLIKLMDREDIELSDYKKS